MGGLPSLLSGTSLLSKSLTLGDRYSCSCIKVIIMRFFPIKILKLSEIQDMHNSYPAIVKSAYCKRALATCSFRIAAFGAMLCSVFRDARSVRHVATAELRTSPTATIRSTFSGHFLSLKRDCENLCASFNLLNRPHSTVGQRNKSRHILLIDTTTQQHGEI